MYKNFENYTNTGNPNPENVNADTVNHNGAARAIEHGMITKLNHSLKDSIKLIKMAKC